MTIDINDIPKDASLTELVEAFIAQRHEKSFWDFKKEWNDNNVDTVHDIICMANNLESDIGYIIIGIDENDEYRTVDVKTNNEYRKNTQMVIDTLEKCSWAYSQPSIEIKEVEFPDGFLDVIVVHSEPEAMPYYLTSNYGPQKNNPKKKKLTAGAIYTRVGETNTPKDSTASPHNTERLWKRHFGIDLVPIDRFAYLLKKHDDWKEANPPASFDSGPFVFAYMNKMDPKFIIATTPDTLRDDWKCYMATTPLNKKPDWRIVHFLYEGTEIDAIHGVNIDRYFFPLPQCDVVPVSLNDDKNTTLFYYYRIDGTLDDCLERFYLNNRTIADSISQVFISKVVPRYRSEAEKRAFEDTVKQVPDKLLDEVNKAEGLLDEIKNMLREQDADVSRLEEEAKYGAALVKLLNQYRCGFLNKEPHNLGE